LADLNFAGQRKLAQVEGTTGSTRKSSHLSVSDIGLSEPNSKGFGGEKSN
jgi:hypothetical protein